MWEAVDWESLNKHFEEEHPFIDEDCRHSFCQKAEVDTNEILEALARGAPNADVSPYKEKYDEDEEDLKGYYEYPYDPYYAKEDDHYCKTCRFKGKANEFFKHLMAVHPDEVRPFLQRFCEDRILRERKLKMPTADNITKEQQTRWASEMVDSAFAEMELTGTSKDALESWLVNTGLVAQREMLEGKRVSCPFCGVSKEALSVADLREKYFQTSVIDYLKKNNPSLQKLRIDDFQGQTFQATWNLQPIHMEILSSIHFAMRHRPQFQELVSSGILKGNLAIYLATFGEQHTTEELALYIQPARERLSKEVQTYLKWLLPKKKQ